VSTWQGGAEGEIQRFVKWETGDYSSLNQDKSASAATIPTP